jgi:hypothetical protein
VRDATSGFFALRRSVIDGVRLDPIGFKIGFEVIARGRYHRVIEVPYTFRDREAGRSKFGTREILSYALQLLKVGRDKLIGRLVPPGAQTEAPERRGRAPGPSERVPRERGRNRP